MAATTTLGPFTWVSRDQRFKLEFFMNQDAVSALLYTKDSKDRYQRTYQVLENDMTVERYNIDQLIRGMNQVTYTVSKLNPGEKHNLLMSLATRQIEIINISKDSGRLNILALP